MSNSSKVTMDLTGDSRFTISDVRELLELLAWLVIALFFLPANLAIMGMYWAGPGLPEFFELGPTYQYTMGWGTGIASAFLWLIIFGWIVAVVEWIGDMRNRYEIYKLERRQRKLGD